ncbi:hypothetical protein HX089_14840 [Myroides odoratimimus]|uniref:hypothetical protein n=1 Tax=Myroides odoratimimus TaxID=76832 RepID=UPI002574CC38|nr:hypothetical protein [Myroides odoratimimus]MDM1517652.1 hypothetical protein [Myroides odoratimimus]
MEKLFLEDIKKTNSEAEITSSSIVKALVKRGYKISLVKVLIALDDKNKTTLDMISSLEEYGVNVFSIENKSIFNKKLYQLNDHRLPQVEPIFDVVITDIIGEQKFSAQLTDLTNSSTIVFYTSK